MQLSVEQIFFKSTYLITVEHKHLLILFYTYICAILKENQSSSDGWCLKIVGIPTASDGIKLFNRRIENTKIL